MGPHPNDGAHLHVHGAWARHAVGWGACVVRDEQCRREPEPERVSAEYTKSEALQALPEGCPSYLGVAAGCDADPTVRLYDANDPAAVTKWRLATVH